MKIKNISFYMLSIAILVLFLLGCASQKSASEIPLAEDVIQEPSVSNASMENKENTLSSNL